MRYNISKRMILFFTILLALTLWSCASQKKKAWNYVQTNPTEFAEWCKERFPNTTTKYIPGKKEIIIDSVFIPGETIECPEPTIENPKPSVKTKGKYIPTEKEKCTPDTIYQTDTREIQIYTNRIADLNKSNSECEISNKELSKKYLETNEYLVKKTSTQYYGWVAFGLILTILIFYKLIKSKFI
ncbi:hypothetical protein [Empedobacter brevis]|uniref:hypothetical protein n=1 Tax=Empedobacter brevis TaxID=247 RepID=UPI0028D4CFCE|nr:hypothetical protein [Empedobacter brevis]